ncbi:porin family protein [Lacibacter sp. H375]|uniref:porin family protein n=1 Tax=Lacibacter sp. H375 TaxID=3133424 RepID=UPI0030C643DA
MQRSILCDAVKHLFLLILCLSVYQPGFTQESPSKVSFGLKGGFGLANISGSVTDEYGGTFSYNSRASVFSGLRLFVPIGENGLFIPEMVLTLKGAKEKRSQPANSPDYYEYSYSLNMFYVELPLNVTYRKATKAGQFFAGGGPSPAITINDNGPAYSPAKSFDLGINLLTGYQFPIGFTLELNYTHGLINISGNGNANLKNSNLGFSLGYVF